MAKKGQAVQLQQELNTDMDWDKMMHKEGLIVVDIYSEWCGPCSAMTANLKKLKLDVGDNLQLAIAKSDKISYLERFRNKSEPTWMLIAEGKMVNLMFGANAPKLVRLIIQELKNEANIKAGNRERVAIEIGELSAEESVRYEAARKIEDEVFKIETEKKGQVTREKYLANANVVLENISPLGIILAFPQAKPQVQSTLSDIWGSAGLAISSTEKVQLTQEKIDELLYFANMEFTKVDADSLINTQGLAYLIRPTNLDDYTGDIDDAVLELVYGSPKCAPGNPESPAQILMARLTKAEMLVKLAGNSKLQQKMAVPSQKPAGDAEQNEEEEEEILELTGLWAPPNMLTKAIGIKLLFPKLYEPIALAESTPIPPHVAVAYEAFKRKEVLDLVNEYREDVIRYGFFSDSNPETATLIAKTLPTFEKVFASGTTHLEKLVVQVSKNRSEPLKAFIELGPIFLSNNYVEGEQHCRTFFPANYDVPEGQKGKAAVKRRRRRHRKAKEPAQQHEAVAEVKKPDNATAVAEEKTEGVQAEGEGGGQRDAEGDGEGEGEGDGEGDGEGHGEDDNDSDGSSTEGEENSAAEDGAIETPPGEADKATSPMPEE